MTVTATLAILLVTAADLRFAVVGDNTGRAKPGVFESVWREIDKLKPAFAINTGDTIEGLDDGKAESEWDALRPLFSSLGKYPRHFTPGNHDIWSAKSRAAYEKFSGRSASYSFNHDGIHITVLDNSETENLTAQQLQFLEQDLADNQNKDVRFVFFHKPFWLIPLKLRSLQMPFHLLMKKYKVHTVFSGHVHQLHRIEREGVTYWCIPSAGGDLRGNSGSYDQGWFYGYIMADVKKTQAIFTIHELPAPHGKGRILDAAKWGENGPAAPTNEGMPK